MKLDVKRILRYEDVANELERLEDWGDDKEPGLSVEQKVLDQLEATRNQEIIIELELEKTRQAAKELEQKLAKSRKAAEEQELARMQKLAEEQELVRRQKLAEEQELARKRKIAEKQKLEERKKIGKEKKSDINRMATMRLEFELEKSRKATKKLEFELEEIRKAFEKLETAKGRKLHREQNSTQGDLPKTGTNRRIKRSSTKKLETDKGQKLHREQKPTQGDLSKIVTHRRTKRSSSNKGGWILGLVASFAILIFSLVVYTSMVPREVNATINGEKQTFITKGYTVERFLEKENIEYCEEDYLSVPPSTFIYDGINIELRNAMNFSITMGGKTTRHKALYGTVEKALKDEKIKTGGLDIITPSLKTPLKENMNIVIQKVVVREEEVEEKVDFKTFKTDDSSMNVGTTKVIKEGKKGTDKVTYKVTYTDGIETAREEVKREVLVAAVNREMAIGTKGGSSVTSATTSSGTSYRQKLIMSAAAVKSKSYAGTVVADSRVLSLGSTMYIEGLGAYRVASSANIGNFIMIYTRTEDEARAVDGKTVTVYLK